ncbi:MAG: DNA mismatch repair protein MutS [Proteobacteria bacterium]|nr:DNA mismatch repair protein MutS [Pseudomonadota bacterium]
MQFGEEMPELTWIQPGLIVYQGYKAKVTPMFEQYLDAKKQNPTALLFFRNGDFYETFFNDAKLLSQACDLILTSRNKGKDGEDIPMAGVPYRTINEYLFQLVEQGFKVAICDQLEDPAQAVGIVKRGITQIVTPGTLCDDRPGYDKNARFLSAVVWHDISRLKTVKKAENAGEMPLCSLASIDMSTGYCTMTELRTLQALQSELLRLNVRELLSHHTAQDEALENLLHGIPITYRERDAFAQQTVLDHWMDDENEGNYAFMSKEKFLSFIDLIDQAHFEMPSLVSEAFCGLLVYLRELHFPLTDNIQQIYPYRAESYMQIDAATFQNLEIYSTLRGNQKNGSLLGELDDTVTGPGSRLLQNWLAYPLKDIKQIRARHDAVEELLGNFECRDDLRKLLKDTADLERLSTKIANDKIVPSELVRLQKTLQIIPSIIERCNACQSAYLKRSATQLNALEKLAQTIDSALIPTAPSNLNDTNFYKPGYDAKLDEYREISENGQQWLLNYEVRQKQETGINSLKVKFQRNFGYFIEVTKSNLSLVPKTYVRSQTLVNCERFYTPELKEYEEELLNAETQRSTRELELFNELKRLAAAQITPLVKNARILAHLDVLSSLAHTAHHRNYVRPTLDDSSLAFNLKGARHPVVERFLPKGERFVPNDIKLDDDGRLLIITGPNMAGKSTIIRQAAIIALMAQMGSFVPAESAVIGIVDRIFSRVGASDNLALGQSTFMVEMTETANILSNATDKSLVILDEIGRGTSTYDGLSLAWAIAEYLHTRIGARALFATHYHELTELANVLKGVRNVSIAVKEYKKDIIFLRKLVDGAANRSYGIQVARLAGIPNEVLERAEQILETLEQNGHQEFVQTPEKPVVQQVTHQQRNLFGDEPAPVTSDPRMQELIHELQNLSLDATTPIQALNWLYKWQKKLRR